MNITLGRSIYLLGHGVILMTLQLCLAPLYMYDMSFETKFYEETGFDMASGVLIRSAESVCGGGRESERMLLLLIFMIFLLPNELLSGCKASGLYGIQRSQQGRTSPSARPASKTNK